MKATCRQVLAPSMPVLSKDMPSRLIPSSGTSFHSLQATSHALQPMQTEVSVKKPDARRVLEVAGVRGRVGQRAVEAVRVRELVVIIVPPAAPVWPALAAHGAPGARRRRW